MIISVDLYNAKPAYQQIADAVREAIALGSLQSGDRLPPIRQTAVNTRVNRNTVSRAYLELEHQGLIQARQGSGFFVTDGGGQEHRNSRYKTLLTKINEVLTEARLSDLSTDQLTQLIRSEAAKVNSTQLTVKKDASDD